MRLGRRTALGFGAAIGTIVLGAIGSGVWELIAKPGVGKIGRLFLGLLTLGSQTVRDAAYASAALDPTPLPGLVLLYLAVPVPVFLLWTFVGTRIAERVIRPLTRGMQSFHKMNESDEHALRAKLEAGEALLSRVQRWRKVVLVVISIFLLGVYAIGYVAFSVLNQSVLIWRVFHANYRICAPYMTPEEQADLQARFAAMQSRADFDPIEKTLVRIAVQRKLKLIRTRLW